jgi:cytochrome c oxidase subunit 4
MSQLEANGHAAHADAHVEPSDGKVHAHISSLRFYVGIFFTLIFFTLLTVAVSDIHLGRLNLVVAVAIASAKASLVLLFFMHLRYDSKFYSMVLVVAVLFIGIFFAYTMNDTERRGEIDPDQGVMYSPETGLAAPGGQPVPAPTTSAEVPGPTPAPKAAEPPPKS